MKLHLVDYFFIGIGLVIGGILALQIRAEPIPVGSSTVDQIEIQKSLLTTFSLEQEELKKKRAELEVKRKEAQELIAKYSSRETLQELELYKSLLGFTPVEGTGIRITLADNPTVNRGDFSAVDENFVQAAYLRDLVNALLLKDARAVSINGKRVDPLTPIQSVFDTILIQNVQVYSPFIIEAVGSAEPLQEAVRSVKKGNTQLYVDTGLTLKIPPFEHTPSLKFVSTAQL